MTSCCLMLMKYDMTTPSRWRDTWTEWTYRILIRGKYRDVTVEYCLRCTCYITKLWLHQYNRKKKKRVSLCSGPDFFFLYVCVLMEKCDAWGSQDSLISGAILLSVWEDVSHATHNNQKNNFVVLKPKDWFHHQFPVCETSWCVGVTGGGQWLERECSVWPNARPPAGQPNTLAYQTVDTPT